MNDVNIAFETCESTIKRSVYYFWRRYGRGRQDYDEMLSLAYEAFCEAWESYDEDLSHIKTWTYGRVYGKLTHFVRSRASRPNIVLDPAVFSEKAQEDKFSLTDFTEGLSENAKEIINLVVFGDSENIGVKGRGRQCIRAALYRYLQKTGWAFTEIYDSFEEIREAL